MTLKEKVDHIQAELQNIVKEDNNNVIKNSVYKYEGNQTTTYKEVQSILKKFWGCNKIYSEMPFVPSYGFMSFGMGMFAAPGQNMQMMMNPQMQF